MSSRKALLLLGVASGVLCASIVLAPVLLADGHRLGGGLLYLLFARVCHQIPERSFWLQGHPLAVCHRCSGIYTGIFMGVILLSRAARRIDRASGWRIWVVAAVLPLLLDAILPYLGIWTNSAGSRFITGMLFGAMLGSLLVPAVSEFLRPSSAGPPVREPTQMTRGAL